ncbi:MAG: alanine--glyoxylate aminotransferase family protein [Candidatus Omnitrophica bacterium]|nr:alanine--glyoxylate aminotransferase family protein [Candidatus Omnitrophota bacterium]
MTEQANLNSKLGHPERSEGSHDPILLTPGPTIVPPEVRQALGRPMVHHRTAEFRAVLQEVESGLKALFKTSELVLILTSSGTGAMEAAAVNLLSAGDEALVIQGGKFGERWREICEAYGVKVIAVDPPWGKPLPPRLISEALRQHPGARAVFATLCETSTGVAYDLKAIRQAMGDCEALLVVDAISGLLAEPFDMDASGVDAAVCGSQKGMMLPPGLAFIALSPRAWEAAKSSRLPKYYFNLLKARASWEKEMDTPFTPAITLLVGLNESLKKIQGQGGVDRFVQRHQGQAQALRQSLQALGLQLYADPACASNAVTAVKVPDGVNGKDLISKIKKQGITVAGGQGKELSGKIFRIASMGVVGSAELDRCLQALTQALTELGWKAPSHG